MKETKEDRSLSALNITQQKFDDAVENEESITDIVICRGTRDLFLEWHTEEFGSPTFNGSSGKWEKSQ